VLESRSGDDAPYRSRKRINFGHSSTLSTVQQSESPVNAGGRISGGILSRSSFAPRFSFSRLAGEPWLAPLSVVLFFIFFKRHATARSHHGRSIPLFKRDAFNARARLDSRHVHDDEKEAMACSSDSGRPRFLFLHS